jgi:hypothetical protein
MEQKRTVRFADPPQSIPNNESNFNEHHENKSSVIENNKDLGYKSLRNNYKVN